MIIWLDDRFFFPTTNCREHNTLHQILHTFKFVNIANRFAIKAKVVAGQVVFVHVLLLFFARPKFFFFAINKARIKLLPNNSALLQISLRIYVNGLYFCSMFCFSSQIHRLRITTHILTWCAYSTPSMNFYIVQYMCVSFVLSETKLHNMARICFSFVISNIHHFRRS